MKNVIKKLSEKLKSKFYFDFDSSKIVWFRAGGKVAIFCLVYNEEELEIILNHIGSFSYEIIGAGSNILIRDKGYQGIIFKLGKNFNKIKLKESFIEVGAGILDVNLSKFAQLNNIKDFEFYSGIPGSIGGAIKMNAGCFGYETKDCLKNIKTINSNRNINILTKENLNLSYRNSLLPDGDIVLSAKFNYSYGDKEEILNKIKEIKFKRESSQPIKFKTSGSTFKNPKKNYAAKLIEMSGCKGLNIGDAYVSDKHANFLINTNKASANEIEQLGRKIIDKVYSKFNIKLDWEIKIIGSY